MLAILDRDTPAARAAWFASPFILLAILWLVIVPAAGVSKLTFPSLGAVAEATVQMVADGSLFVQIGASLLRVVAGAALAILIGIPFGIIMGVNNAVSTFFSPLLRFSVALAGIAWIPLATLWLGYGEAAVVFIVFNAVFFAIVYNVVLGVRQVNTDLIRAARSLGAGRMRILWEIYLPGAMPSITVGLRVGMGFAWRGLIAAEIIASGSGLGYTLFLARKYYNTDIIVLMMILIGVLWLMMDRWVLVPFENRTTVRWGASEWSAT